MTEINYIQRFEAKLDSLQDDMHNMSKQITQLTTELSSHSHNGSDTARRVTDLSNQVRAAENQINTALGAVALLRWVVGLIFCILISSVSWIASTVLDNKQSISIINTKLIRLDTDIQSNEDAINKLLMENHREANK